MFCFISMGVGLKKGDDLRSDNRKSLSTRTGLKTFFVGGGMVGLLETYFLIHPLLLPRTASAKKMKVFVCVCFLCFSSAHIFPEKLDKKSSSLGGCTF